MDLLPGAHADDEITAPLIDAINRNTTSAYEAQVAAGAAIVALNNNANAFGSTVGNILGSAGSSPEAPAAALAALQAAATAEVGSLAGIGLAQALTLSSKVAAPSCSTIGALTATLPDIALLPPPTTLLGPLAPIVDAINKGISDAYYTTYTQAFAQLLTPPTLPPGTEAAAGYVTLAQTLLTLLKFNWHTEYFPPGGGASVVRDTPGFLGLPVFLDSDGRSGPDICAISTFDLTSGKIVQSIARMPGSPSTMPLNIKGEFLFGVIAAGYETKNSKAPASFDTTTNLTANPTTTTAYKTGASFDQFVSLASSITYRLSSAKPTTNYTFGSTKPTTKATQFAYTGKTKADGFTYSASFGSLSLGSLSLTPAPTSAEWCTATDATCSNAPAADKATETASLHLLASEPITLAQNVAPGTACSPSVGRTALYGSRVYLGYNPIRSTSTAGHVWADTDNTAAGGCVGNAAGLTGILSTGFSANDRLGRWKSDAALPPAIFKSGTISAACTTSTLAASFALAGYLCNVPARNNPANPPKIEGDPYLDSLLTLNYGEWPAAPNRPDFTRVWKRCNAAGLPCTTIAGVTGETYTPDDPDQGMRLKVELTGVSVEGGPQTVITALTAVLTDPPPPVLVLTAPPVLTGTRKIGDAMSVSTGTWSNGVKTYAYQWYRCEEADTTCITSVEGANSIGGATSNTYPLAPADLGKKLQVRVKATNRGGSTLANTATLLIPPPPVNLTPPVIRRGTDIVSGLLVLEGDKLRSVDDGTWKYAEAFTRKWMRCDELGANCAPIVPAVTGATYTVGNADVGKTLAVEVTATNPNGPMPQLSPATGLVLPNLVPDGPILSSAPSSGGNTFVGGSFDTVGPRIGGAGVVPTAAASAKSASIGALVAGGKVNAVAPDGASGYFLGGTFTSVRGTGCKAVAHVKSDGSLDPAYCQAGLAAGYEVRALDYVKRSVTPVGGAATPIDLLAVGGSFTKDGHTHLMFLGPDGTPSYPTNEPNGPVNAVVNETAVGSRPYFYIGGAFTKLGTADALRLGRVAVTGVPASGVTPLAATANLGGVACTGSCTAEVKAMTALAHISFSGTFVEIVAGGTFDTAYSVTAPTTAVARTNAVAFATQANSPANAAPAAPVLGAWNPAPNGPITALGNTSGAALSGAPPASVYLVGDFTTLLGGAQTGFNGLAEFGITNAASGTLRTNGNNTVGTAATSSPNTAWKPSVSGGKVLAVLAADAGVYLAGSFTGVGTASRHRLAHITAPNANAPTVNAWDPNAGQTVRAIGNFTGRIIAGGDFEVLGGQTRNNLAELTDEGTLSAWAPAGTNGPVHALVTDNDAVYAGGDFSAAGADVRSNLAAFNRGTGATGAWNPGANGVVKALSRNGSTVYVGGQFATLGGASRANLGAVDTAGALTGWDPQATGTGAVVRALAVDGTTAYVGGTFANAGAAARSNVAAINTATGAATTWNPGTNGAVHALAVTASTVYLGGQFTAVAGQSRTNAAAVDRGTAAATGWDPQANGIVRALAVLDAVVFAGGDFTTIGGQARAYGAGLDATIGAATDFNPGFDARVWSISVRTGGPTAFLGEFRSRGATPAGGFAFFAV